jgi:hypothetical protein
MTRATKFVLYGGTAALVAAFAAVAFVVSQTAVDPESIRSSVTRTEQKIEQAWNLPAASTFKKEVTWQSNASLCGPASVANAFRSLGESATRESTVLAGTGRCWTGFCVIGLTLDELADVARTKTKRTVTVLRDLTAAEFQEHLKRTNDTGRRYIINFSRKEIFGAGAGHHSPIGGYLEAEDLVFVLDVNRDYQPWLVERNRLFQAMDTLDGAQKRGLLLIE